MPRVPFLSCQMSAIILLHDWDEKGLFVGLSSETERASDCPARSRDVFGDFAGAAWGPAALRIGSSLRGYPDDGSRLDVRERGVDFFYERREVLAGVAPRPKQDNREAEPGEVLLVRDALVRAHQHVELVLGQAEELAVLLSGPAGLGHGRDLPKPVRVIKVDEKHDRHKRELGDEGGRWALAAVVDALLLLDDDARDAALEQIKTLLIKQFRGRPIDMALAQYDRKSPLDSSAAATRLTTV